MLLPPPYFVSPVVQREYFLSFAHALRLQAVNQFVFLGPTPQDDGAFEPVRFAQEFVFPLAQMGITVNVFFDDTVLPPRAADPARWYRRDADADADGFGDDDNIDLTCQAPCGGRHISCPCNSTSLPSDCLWKKCSPVAPLPETDVPGPPACCCGSMTIKMKWVMAVQQELRRIDPTLTLTGVNLDVETVCDEFRPLMLTYMRTYLTQQGEPHITVGDTIGYVAGSYVQDRLGIQSMENGFPMTPLAVLWVQNYNLPSDTGRGFEWYAAQYAASISPNATNATLQVMGTLNCCDAPCASKSCSDCGVCCSADNSCVSPLQQPKSDPWGAPGAAGAFCPYHTLPNGTAITVDTLLDTFEAALAAMYAAPGAATFAARGITVSFATYTMRALHVLLFGEDFSCAACNDCKPHIFGASQYDACTAKPCKPTDPLCPCNAEGVPAFM